MLLSAVLKFEELGLFWKEPSIASMFGRVEGSKYSDYFQKDKLECIYIAGSLVWKIDSFYRDGEVGRLPKWEVFGFLLIYSLMNSIQRTHGYMMMYDARKQTGQPGFWFCFLGLPARDCEGLQRSVFLLHRHRTFAHRCID